MVTLGDIKKHIRTGELSGNIYRFHGQTVHLRWSRGDVLRDDTMTISYPMEDENGNEHQITEDVWCEDELALFVYKDDPAELKELGVITSSGEIIDCDWVPSECGGVTANVKRIGHVNDLDLVFGPDMSWLGM